MSHLLVRILFLLALFMPVCTWAEEVVSPCKTFPCLQTVNGVDDSLAPLTNSLSGNRITMNSGIVEGNVYGAVNTSDTTAVSGNSVVINNGATVDKNVYGGYSLGNATTNTVSIYAKVVEVYGGYSTTSTTGNASGNIVHIYDSATVGNVYGGYRAIWENVKE